MNRLKKIISCCCVLICALAFSGCSSKETESIEAGTVTMISYADTTTPVTYTLDYSDTEEILTQQFKDGRAFDVLAYEGEGVILIEIDKSSLDEIKLDKIVLNGKDYNSGNVLLYIEPDKSDIVEFYYTSKE